MTPESVKAIFQGVIAVVVIVGGGVFAYLKPDNAQAVWGIVGTVVAYYFLSATQTNAIRATVTALSAESQKSQPAASFQAKK